MRRTTFKKPARRGDAFFTWFVLSPSFSVFFFAFHMHHMNAWTNGSALTHTHIHIMCNRLVLQSGCLLLDALIYIYVDFIIGFTDFPCYLTSEMRNTCVPSAYGPRGPLHCKMKKWGRERGTKRYQIHSNRFEFNKHKLLYMPIEKRWRHQIRQKMIIIITGERTIFIFFLFVWFFILFCRSMHWDA